MKSFDISVLDSLEPGDVVSVTGCGGKTTLIEYMASVLSEKYRVGIGTTVNIAFPPKGSYDRMYIGRCDEEIKMPGIYYFADEIREPFGKSDVRKLHGLSENLKHQALLKTDILLIEADGSAGRPVKVWRADEPVIVPETTVTIGVCAPDCIGKPANGTTVHRLAVYEAKHGHVTTVTEEMFLRMSVSPDGMFAHARGETFLWKNQADIAAIVLASGFSRRMGANKLLLNMDDMPMIAHVFEAVAASDFSEKYVVTNQEEVSALARDRHFHIIRNSRADEGQSTSVVCGTCEAMAKNPEGLMFFMGDMPFIEPGMIRKLKTAFAACGGQKIIVPEYPDKNGGFRRGNPVMFPAKYAGALAALKGDIGGRAVISANEKDVYKVHFTNARWGFDIDAPDDLKNLDRWRRK